MISALAILVVFALNTSDIYAQGKGKAQKTITGAFADADGDGVPNGQDSDFVQGTGQGKGLKVNFIDENGDGICDYFQNGTRTNSRFGKNIANRNFVDADGNSVCDNYGTSQGRGLRNGTGRGLNFIDQDGDGVCDLFQAGSKIGQNFRKGFRNGGRNK